MTEAQNAAAPLDLTDYGDAVLFAAEAQRAGFPRVAVAPEHFLALVAEVSTVRRERDDLREAALAAWHQLNSAGLNREQLAALNRLHAAASK